MLTGIAEVNAALKRAMPAARSKLHLPLVWDGCAADSTGNYFVVEIAHNDTVAERAKLVSFLKERQLDAEVDGRRVRVYVHRENIHA